MTDKQEVQLPELPPNWYYEFSIIKTDYSDKSFEILIKNDNVKMGSRKVYVAPQATPSLIRRDFDKALDQLSKDAWAMENPDKQWAEINKFRWAINDLIDDIKK